MGSKTETYLATLETLVCGECGIPFAFPEHTVESRRQDGKTFYCPNGHGRAFVDSEVKRLARQLKAAEANASWYEQRAERKERERRAAKGQLTKLKNKIARGECPCCHEHFPNLEAHMTEVHPGFVQEEAPDAQ